MANTDTALYYHVVFSTKNRVTYIVGSIVADATRVMNDRADPWVETHG